MSKRPSIHHHIKQLFSTPSLRKRAIWIAFGVAFIWVGFFDSHSIYKRLSWHTEAQAIASENLELQQEIERLDRQLEVDVSDEVIEQLAREEYGMRKEGETVYPIKEIE